MIHRFKIDGLNIVLDVNSGSIHLVDDLTYDILELYPNHMEDEIVELLKFKYGEEEITEAINEVNELVEGGQLFSMDPGMGYSMNGYKPVVKALCVHPAHDCNLKCDYCFASSGSYNQDRCYMSLETGRQCVDFLIKNSGNTKLLEIDFFGGEPLMNFDVVKDMVYYAKQKGMEHNKEFSFTITTNATLLDDGAIDFINENMYNVVLSLDGRKEVNDRFRHNHANEGTYDIVLKNINKLLSKRGDKEYYIRGTYTRCNLDFTEDVRAIADLGYKEISLEPVVSKDERFALTEDDLPSIFSEYEKLMRFCLEREREGKPINFYHFNIDLNGGPCILKRITGCGAGFEYLAVDPSGKIYPCHQFVGMDEYVMGNIFDGIKDENIGKAFLNSNIYTKEECRNCWAKFYCSGGCHASNIKIGGGLDKTYRLGCEITKKRLEYAIAMQLKKMVGESS
ncbi:thioether cross-link-forming SCIFF peptide maturase [Calorimonas adulescens]|uniref:Thioether cross-link-forming SCIFF peptide maturase n=1 Tax=Calorimonas adulescens TaxID=2606906 RepID=A0A5D8QJ35_9THEO|nr:thioether cross-link-forming SCIFF peptide maturase [Calorimonas adulescens]TZE83513.1 thioether cross-link-forming SCIFF peptide maturase [Calorimonas adulescens]